MGYRIIPAIMSGGAGTRLWPLSTEAKPKQFHAIATEKSLFETTLARLSGDHGAITFEAPIILCNAGQASHVRQNALPRGAALVLEPEPRNTAAVAAIAAALARDADALVLLAPADHLIADEAAFWAAMARAARFASERIVTFGMTPDRAATGYGYIKRGAPLGEGVFSIAAFKEKPSRETAESYLAEGGYYWNAGMFLFHPSVMLDAFDAAPDIRDAALTALAMSKREGDEISLDADSFRKIPSEPLDIAVMEKASRSAVAPCDIGWADVGAWDEVWRLSPKDEAGNAVSGAVTIHDARDTLVHAEGVKVCVAGVSDLVIVATPEAVIVVPRERAQDVKALREAALKPKP